MIRQQKQSTIMLQRKFRSFYKKPVKGTLNIREFTETKAEYMGELSRLEQNLLFGNTLEDIGKDAFRMENVTSELYGKLAASKDKNKRNAVAHHLKTVSPYGSQKIYAFMLVLDIHLLVWLIDLSCE